MSIEKYNRDLKRYLVRLRDKNGKSYTKVLAKGITKTQAKKFETEWLTALNEEVDKVSGLDNDPYLVTLLERWLTKVAIHLKGVERYESHARMITPYLKDYTIKDVVVVANTIKEDMLSLDYAPATVNHRIGILQRIAKLAFNEWGFLNEDLGAKIKKARNRKNKELYMTENEIYTLYVSVCSLSPAAGNLLLFSAYTGIRWAELERLTIDSFDSRLNKETGVYDLWLVITETKESRPRAFPLSNKAYEAYDKYCEAFPISESYNFVYRRFKEGLKNSGLIKQRPELKDFTWHDLRHSFASLLAQGGASITVLQNMLGHRTLSSTQRYSHLCESNFEEAIKILNKHSSTPRLVIDNTKNELQE